MNRNKDQGPGLGTDHSPDQTGNRYTGQDPGAVVGRERDLPRTIDRALARSLVAPPLPPRFRAGLRAAMARAGQVDIGLLRQRYEREQAQRLADLERNYIRLRRRTLGSMIGGAFVAGAAAALAMPWFSAHFGALAPAIVASAGALAGLGIGFLAWQRGRAGFAARG